MSAEEGLVIDYDPGSFTRAERRELQDRFGRPFDQLLEYVSDGWFRRPIRVPQEDGTWTAARLPAPEPFEVTTRDVVGNGSEARVETRMVYPDDVLIAMLAIIARRSDESADESVFDEMTADDLTRAIERGRAGKAKTASP